MEFRECNGSFFIAKEGHFQWCEDCKVLPDKDTIQRKIAFASLRGHKPVIFQCDTACPKCIKEQGESLWLTTKESPRSLEELLGITDDGKK